MTLPHHTTTWCCHMVSFDLCHVLLRNRPLGYSIVLIQASTCLFVSVPHHLFVALLTHVYCITSVHHLCTAICYQCNLTRYEGKSYIWWFSCATLGHAFKIPRWLDTLFIVEPCFTRILTQTPSMKIWIGVFLLKCLPCAKSKYHDGQISLPLHGTLLF